MENRVKLPSNPGRVCASLLLKKPIETRTLNTPGPLFLYSRNRTKVKNPTNLHDRELQSLMR
jgi:hypothetical protein